MDGDDTISLVKRNNGRNMPTFVTQDPESSHDPTLKSPVRDPSGPLARDPGSSIDDGSILTERRIDVRGEVREREHEDDILQDVERRSHDRTFKALARDHAQEFLDRHVWRDEGWVRVFERRQQRSRRTGWGRLIRVRGERWLSLSWVTLA